MSPPTRLTQRVDRERIGMNAQPGATSLCDRRMAGRCEQRCDVACGTVDREMVQGASQWAHGCSEHESCYYQHNREFEQCDAAHH